MEFRGRTEDIFWPFASHETNARVWNVANLLYKGWHGRWLLTAPFQTLKHSEGKSRRDVAVVIRADIALPPRRLLEIRVGTANRERPGFRASSLGRLQFFDTGVVKVVASSFPQPRPGAWAGPRVRRFEPAPVTVCWSAWARESRPTKWVALRATGPRLLR